MDKSAILAVLDNAEAVYLATTSAEGPVIRALVNLRRADLYPTPSRLARTDDYTIYLSTSRASSKVAEIAADPRVALYYCLPQRYLGVTLSGNAQISEDEALRQGLWHDSWRIYWPDGPENPDYCIVRVQATKVFGWHGSAPFAAGLT